jgi:NAD(P)-dependent dehydrogenase (short-subunit alcohol dehydrogenase family)
MIQELQSLAQANANVSVVKFDVRDYASHESLVQTVASAVQDRGLDVLINNAGIYNKVSLESGGPELIMENVEVNAVAPFYLTRSLLPLLRQSAKAQSGGRKTVVANITSQMGSIADNSSGGHYAYRTSKVSDYHRYESSLFHAIDLMKKHDAKKNRRR